MAATLIVLWILLSVPWSYGSIPLTEGWWATKFIYTEQSLCQGRGERVVAEGRAADFACVKAGDDPPGELSKIRR